MSDQNTTDTNIADITTLTIKSKHYILVEYADKDLDGDDPEVTIGGNPNAAMLKGAIEVAAIELAQLYCANLSGYDKDAVIDWAVDRAVPGVKTLHESLLRGIVDDHLRDI